MKDSYLRQEPIHQSTKRFVLLLLMIAFLVLCFFSGTKLMETYHEYQAFRGQQAENQENLDLARLELEKKERYMDLLESDPELLEHVARQRLQYSKPNELIFHFK